MKATLHLLAIITMLSSAVSCKKNATLPSTPEDKASKIQFGAMFSDISSAQAKIDVLKQLHVNTTRMTMSMDTWTGKNPSLETLQNAGYKVLLNVYWKKIMEDSIKTPQPFPKDNELALYRSKLDEILTAYKPEILLIENEELVLKFHSGDIDDYLNMLKVAVDVAHSKGIKVSDGGITNPQISLLVYNNLISQNKVSEANQYANATMTPQVLSFAHNQDMNTDLGKKLSQAQKLIAGLQNINIDYVNLHWYEQLGNKASSSNNTNAVSTGQLNYAISYLNQAIKKPIIIGECGQIDADASLTTSMLQEITNMRTPYAIWFSTNNGTTKALNDGNSLLPTGYAFVNFIDSYQK
jgi:hypothetical protein